MEKKGDEKVEGYAVSGLKNKSQEVGSERKKREEKSAR